ncbi:MAG: putative porin [Pseudomonadota bacterium]
MIPNKSLAACAALLMCASVAHAAQSSEERRLSELRNTVVNLLQGLVERGVITREQAEKMVADAQTKAEADAAVLAATEQAEAGAVRVPYIPEIVKQEIRTQVSADLKREVTAEVIEQAKVEDWAIPGALPDWIRRLRFSGDIRLRGQGDTFAEDNVTGAYVDFLTVNDRGGIGRAGTAALVNTTEERQRLRARLRFGFDTELGYGWSAGFKLATGSNLRDAVSTNQTLGNTGARYTIGVDQAYLRHTGVSHSNRRQLTLTGGRMTNPWSSTDLVFDNDLNFEGITANYRVALQRDELFSRFVYLTLGGFPIEEFEINNEDKWLLGGQLGMEFKLDSGSRLKVAGAYYDYRNMVGQRNVLDSNLLDYSAPKFLQRGNTLFDIRNDADGTTNLFALAAQYRLADVTASFDWRLSPEYRLAFSGNYVKNIGYDEAEVNQRLGLAIEPRTRGYQFESAFGSTNMAKASAWRVSLAYRYLERDAVLDAFTDSDFRLGGTDVKGFIIGGDYSLTPRMLLRARYLSGNEIDGPPLGIDVFQLDLNSTF